MTKTLSTVLKYLAGLALCALLLIGATPEAKAGMTFTSEIYVNAGEEQKLQLDMGELNVIIAEGNGTREAVSTIPDVVSVRFSQAYPQGFTISNKAYINFMPKKAGTAYINFTFRGKYDGLWQEITLSIKVNVHEHNYTKFTEVVETTCTDGRYYHYCLGCNDYYYTTVKAPHNYGETVVSKKPTATENGERAQFCSLCNKKKVIETITTDHAAHINTQPQNVYAKVGSKASVSVDAGGDSLSYQWYVKNYGSSSFTKSSIKTNTYSVTMSAENTGRQVYCEITDQYGNKVKTNTVTLYSDALIKQQPASASAYRDDKVSATVEAVGQGLTYEWYVMDTSSNSFSKSSITGKTYSVLMNDARNGRKAYCIVSDKHGNSVRSQFVTFTMKADRPVFITKQPASVKVFEGEKAAVSVKATGKGMTYQWYFKNPGATKFSKTSTFTGNSYSITMDESRDGRQVYCVITDAYGNKTTSDTVTLSMKHTAKIVTQPKNASAVNGAKVQTSVKATGDGLTYQWYIKSAAGSTFSKSSVTKATYSTTMSAAANGRKAYCVITDKYGTSVKTNTITLSRSNNITITRQPADAAAVEGSKAVVSFKATGEGLTYTWYYKNDGAAKFVKTTSFKGTTYSVAMSPERHGRQVYCLITDKYGTTQKTNTVTLSMDYPLSITRQPASVSAYYGEKASVSTAAEGYGLTYQWYVKNAGESAFSKASAASQTYSITMNGAQNGQQVFCRVTDLFGESVDTKTVTLSMKNKITVTQQPADVMAIKGAKAAVSFKAEGEGLTYAWYFKDASASAFSKTTTFKGTSYSVTMSDERDGRQVYCKITDKYGYSVKTATVTLTADPEPIKIINKTGTEAAKKGEAISFSIEAEGHGLTYQWFVDRHDSSDVEIVGANGSTYSSTMSESNHYAYFSCLITDQYGNTLLCKFPAVKGKDIVIINRFVVDGTANKNDYYYNYCYFTIVGDWSDHTHRWSVNNGTYITEDGGTAIRVKATRNLTVTVGLYVTNEFGYTEYVYKNLETSGY